MARGQSDDSSSSSSSRSARVHHVGSYYAGGGTVRHAPNSGSAVGQEPIWTSSVFYGRVF